jgi:hypothetical protein
LSVGILQSPELKWLRILETLEGGPESFDVVIDNEDCESPAFGDWVSVEQKLAMSAKEAEISTILRRRREKARLIRA